MITNNSPHLGVLFGRLLLKRSFPQVSSHPSSLQCQLCYQPRQSPMLTGTRQQHGLNTEVAFRAINTRLGNGDGTERMAARTMQPRLSPNTSLDPRTATSNINGKQCRAGLVDVPDAVPRNAMRHVVVLDRLVWASMKSLKKNQAKGANFTHEHCVKKKSRKPTLGVVRRQWKSCTSWYLGSPSGARILLV